MTLTFLALALCVGAIAAAAALAAERFMITRRGAPLRWVWLIAMLVTMAYPLFRVNREHGIGVERRVAAASAASSIATPTSPRATALSSLDPREPESPSFATRVTEVMQRALTLPAISRRTERALLSLWGGLSAAMALVVLVSLVRLRRDMRRWPR